MLRRSRLLQWDMHVFELGSRQLWCLWKSLSRSRPFLHERDIADEHCNGANLNWDNSNCGFCGNVCPAQFSCVYGVCEGSGY